MMRTRFITLALGLIAGIVLGTMLQLPVHPLILILVAIAGVAGGIYFFIREVQWKHVPLAFVILTAFLASVPLGYMRTLEKVGEPAEGTLQAYLATLPNKTRIHIRGRIAAEPERRGHDEGALTLSVSEVKAENNDEWVEVTPGNVRVRFLLGKYDQENAKKTFNRLMDPDAYGYDVECETTYYTLEEDKNPGGFHLKTYLFQYGYVAQVACYPNSIVVRKETRGNPFTELALMAKKRFLLTFKRAIGSPASRLVAAATLGARSAVRDETYRDMDITEMFQRAGVGHVLAVSGLHVTVIALLLYTLFLLIGIKPHQFAPVVIIMLILFALLTGARPSTVRAVVMNSVTLVALAYFRYNLRHATFIGLSVSSFFILLFNPIVLFSPSFLLSYGAVLSLVLITTPLERFILHLRGAALFFLILWIVGVVALASQGMGFFLSPLNVLALAGVLWLFILIGNTINLRVPKLYHVGFDKVPQEARSLIVAQFAIQLGMMIPLTAWFFGQFPVAGMIVNLVAIPLVGVVVQLGMLTGLVGLIPFIGTWIALPFGATATVTGHLFLITAYGGAKAFAYPAMPKPTFSWMIAHYVVLFLLLSLDGIKTKIQAWAFRRFTDLKARKTLLTLVAYALPAILVLLPLFRLIPSQPSIENITVYDSRTFPLVSITSKGGTEAVAVNPGDYWTGSVILFNGLRIRGAVDIDHAIITGYEPKMGTAGFSPLAEKMPIAAATVPVVARGGSDAFLSAVGDSYLEYTVRKGKPWANEIVSSYTTFITNADARGVRVRSFSDAGAIEWKDTRIRVHTAPKGISNRYVANAQGGVVEISAKGHTIYVVSDVPPYVLTSLFAESVSCDVLVLGRNQRIPYYESMVAAATGSIRAKLVIFCNAGYDTSFDPLAWCAEHAIGCDEVLLTDDDGAVSFTFRDGVMECKTYTSGRRLRF